jgi:hypothetical protein
MSKKCQHEADWDSIGVVDRSYEGCSVGLQCLHCDTFACADLGPEHFRWDDDANEQLIPVPPRRRPPDDAW